MMTWGFPCQDISVAGRLEGVTENTRSGLYYQGIRILNETKPKYSIIENVKNLTSKRFKETFEMILKDLENAGYNSYWKVLNAKNYGVPQNRERVFIVSIRKDIDKGQFEFPEAFERSKRLKDVLEDDVDPKYFLSEKMIQGFIAHNEKHKQKGTGFIWKTRDIEKEASTIRANAALCPTDNTIKVKDNANGNIIEAGNLNKEGWYKSNNIVYSPEGIAPTVITMQGGNVKPKVLLEEDKKETSNIMVAGNLNHKGWFDLANTVYSPEGIAPTVNASHGNTKSKIKVDRIGGIFDKDGKRHQAGSIYSKEGIAPAIDSMQGGYRQPMVDVINATKKGYDTAKIGDSINIAYPYSNKRRGRVGHGVAQTLDTGCRLATLANTPPEYKIRRLTPIECWRLMRI